MTRGWSGMTEILRYAAFTSDPAGGNPAGVVLNATRLGDADMQEIAAKVGYSETAFLVPRQTPGAYDVRYFAPAAEVPFCGHATIAAAVALAERGAPPDLLFHTLAGDVRIVATTTDGHVAATLTSVPPYVEDVNDALVTQAIAALNWDASDLDPTMPAKVAYAGARHLVLAVSTRARLAVLDYDFDALRALMEAHQLTTVHLAWRETPLVHHVRDPFPVGGVVEDPATGAAAAAYGAYLRAIRAVNPPVTLTLHQGTDMGRPSLLVVDVAEGDQAPIRVTGTAVRIRQ